MKQVSKKYILNLLLILLLTGFALWFALKDDYEQVLGVLKNISWFSMIIIIIGSLFYNGMVGCILTSIAREHKHDYKLKDGIVVGFIGSFFSGITPSASGGQFGQIYAFKKQGIRPSEGASILWLDFITYQTVLMLYAALLMILRFGYYYANYSFLFTFIFIGFLLNFSVIGLLWTMAKFPKLYMKLSGTVVRLQHKMHIVKDEEKTLASWNEQLSSFNIEINRNRNNKKLILKVAGYNVIRLTIYFSLPFFIGLVLGVPAKDMPIIDVIALSSFVTMSNSFFPVPGASGGTEMMFVQIFSLLISAKYASSIMIIWRFATYHLILLIGGTLFIFIKQHSAHGMQTEE